MRAAFWLLAIASLTIAQDIEDTGEPWVEEEELEEPYADEREDHAHSRKAYVDEPYEEQVRVRRRCCDYEYDPTPPQRTKRSPEPEQYNRKPRQVHQYEVHEFTDEGSSFPSPPYEEMLAASAEHYHRVYAAPDASASIHYHSPEVSAKVPIPLGVHSVPNAAQFAAAGAGPAARPVAFIPPQYKQGQQLPFREAYVANNANPASVFVKANKSVPPSSPVQFIAPVRTARIPIALTVPDAPVVGPAPVPSTPVPAAPPQRLTGDQSSAAAGHHHQHHHRSGHSHNAGGGHHHHGGHGHSAGGGQRHHGAHHGAHEGKV